LARGKLKLAKEASTEMTKKNQEEIDTICKAIAKAAYDHREELARMAVEDTGFGNVEDKIIKNSFAARGVLNAMENMKTIGIINKDPENKVMEIAVPNGVIAGLIPSTNPTSTVIYKALIALKGGNMDDALGMIETRGLVTPTEAAGAMVKTVMPSLVGKEPVVNSLSKLCVKFKK